MVTGSLLGAIFPIGKLVASAGIGAPTWAFVISAGTGSILVFAQLVRGRMQAPDHARLRYYGITGLISYAIPNVLVFLVVGPLGAGLTGLMFTLSPLFTILLSRIAGTGSLAPLGLAGIATGCAGAVIIAASGRASGGSGAALLWLVPALAIPAFLAAGNVYRTLAWPSGADPIELAAGSHLAAAFVLLVLGPLAPGPFLPAALGGATVLMAAQIAISVLMFVVFFRLQAVGGPVYLSQISYVGAAVALLSGMVLLGERHPASTWAGAAIIAGGVAMTTLARRGR